MSITEQDPNAFLMATGGKSAKFPEVGATVRGEILDMVVSQQTDMKSGAPKFWDNGDPMRQLVITLQTDERDADDADDDGIRKLYLKGGNKPTTSQGAVAAAVKKSGASALERGGTLALKYTGDGEPSQRGFNPPKLYAAKYEPPTKVDQAAVDDFFGE
jgi:hypothetical protein